MSRFGGTVRTYGRPAAKENVNSVFDAIIADSKTTDSRPSASMTTSTVHRFGKTSFTSSRTKDTEVEPKKRKIEKEKKEDIFDDPFSFDSDGDDGAKTGKGGKSGAKSSKTSKAQANNSTRGRRANGTKPINTVIISRKKKTNEEDEDEFVVKQGNSYSNNSTTTSKSKGAAHTSKKNTSSTASSSSGKGRQLSMDNFTQKLPPKTYNPVKTSNHTDEFSLSQDSVFSCTVKKRKASSKPLVKKFFTSSQDSGLSDHTYSQSSIAFSSLDSDDEESHASSSNFLVDSDIEVESSGDPEIVFNSPKRRAEDLQRRIEGEQSDTDTTDESDKKSEDRTSPTSVISLDNGSVSGGNQKPGRDSPSSVMSMESEAGSVKSSNSLLQKDSSKTDRTSKLLIKKSSSDGNTLFNFDKNKGTVGYGTRKRDASSVKDRTEQDNKFSALVGKKLLEGKKLSDDPNGEKKKESAPLVRRLLTSPKKVRNVMCIKLTSTLKF